MSKQHLHLIGLTFRYETAAEPLFRDLSITLPQGWTGVVGANGAGKSTLLRLATGLLEPLDGGVSLPGRGVYVEQRTDEPPPELGEFVWTWEGSAPRLRDRFAVADDYPDRWQSLSHGERKRAQIAVALWREPDVLAIDEPTNHLDGEARSLLADALAEFRGIGLIVSHDRALLDRLCAQCLFLREHGPTLRPGGVSDGLEEEERQVGRQREEYGAAKVELSRLRKEADRRSRAAAGADKKKSKRLIDPKDKAAKFQMDVNRVTGKDAVAGKLLRQLDGRLKHAEAKVNGGTPPPVRKLGVTMAGEVARSAALFRRDEGALALGPADGGVLVHGRLRVEPTDRIAVVGPNGSGKSTLVRAIMAEVASESTVYLPQEISVADANTVVERVRRLSNDELGRILSTVSRLGSDPEALLSTEVPSPGETRKLLLAEGLAKSPSLVVLDEPTNHMDLPSIRCLEEALSETVCALLLVSHDEVFLRSLASKWWRIAEVNRRRYALSVE